MIAPANGYSSDIEGYLETGLGKFRLARINGERFGLHEPVNLPPGEAELVLSFDGIDERSRIMLPDGSSASEQFVAYRNI